MDDADLQALIARVADLERRVQALDGQQGAAPADPGSDAEIRDLVRQGDKVKAIARYRELTGVGLREAMDAVERINVGL